MRRIAEGLFDAKKTHPFLFETLYLGLVFPVVVLNVFEIRKGTGLWWYDLITYSLLIAVSGFRYGVDTHARQMAAVDAEVRGAMPGSIAWDRNEDTGQITALVQRGDGEVSVIPIPEDKAHSPFSALQYVIAQMLEIDEDDISSD